MLYSVSQYNSQQWLAPLIPPSLTSVSHGDGFICQGHVSFGLHSGIDYQDFTEDDPMGLYLSSLSKEVGRGPEKVSSDIPFSGAAVEDAAHKAYSRES